jgi:LPXTG-motif cell wall-anchored protein
MLDGSTHAGVTQKKDLTDVVFANGNHTTKPLEGSDNHYVFTATNERMGFLKIQKTVLYNGENPIDLDDKTILDGTYTFAVYQDEDCLMPVQIDGEDLTISISVVNGEPNTSDLLVLSLGTYWIREIDSTNAGAVLLNDEAVLIDLTSTSTHDNPTIINIKNNYLDIALPVTGGHGTIINNILGILMIIISITIFIKGKRLKNE